MALDLECQREGFTQRERRPGWELENFIDSPGRIGMVLRDTTTDNTRVQAFSQLDAQYQSVCSVVPCRAANSLV